MSLVRFRPAYFIDLGSTGIANQEVFAELHYAVSIADPSGYNLRH